MAQLRGADLAAILTLLGDVDDLDVGSPFTPETLSLLARLVGAEAAAYEHREWGARLPIDQSEFDPRGIDGPSDDVYVALEHECAFVVRRNETRDPGAMRMCDLIGDRALHRLAIYSDWLHPWRIEQSVELPLPAPVGQYRFLSFCNSDRRFTIRDQSVLDALRPHLVRLERHAAYRRRATDAFAGDGLPSLDVIPVGLTKRESEILALVAAGGTNAQIARQLWVSPGTIRTHLEHIYAKLEVSNRTSAVARLHSQTRVS